ncbi:MAG: FAD-dependent oxidoreductase [Gammaproteobacteria bacterium]|nr:FAD-dependent oxidoreductase [Gammaproteobacteria bacterium]
MRFPGGRALYAVCREEITNVQQQTAAGADPVTADLVVLGSGAAGLTAALTASLAGLQVIVLEHARDVGGTSARSSGTVWVPGNHYVRTHSGHDDREHAGRYLASLAGERDEPVMRKAYLDNAPLMIEDLHERAGIRFRPYLTAPDYRQDHPGAASGGRPLEPLPFDGRLLGAEFSRLAWPLPELMLFGRMMVTRGETAQLLQADRSLPAMWLGTCLLERYLRDRMRYARGTRLVLGNALVARLYKALLDRRAPVWTSAHCERLLESGGRICAVEVAREGQVVTVRARCGVVLAGGGFPASAAWRARHLPAPLAEHTPAAPGCDGSTLDLAVAAGAALGPAGVDNALWFPSSIATRPDGSTAVYPHIVLDRAKPGLIAVNQQGQRFVDEAVSYHEFVRAMHRAHRESASIPAWLICDRPFIRRYGLGLVRPRTRSLRKYVASGYLHTAPTLEDLAGRIGLSAAGLQSTVARFNGFVRAGVDEDFDKGGNIYDRSGGDANVRPNPCLGPISTPPFYALPVLPTPLGTSRGLLTDSRARVCTASGEPIPGLYVCGNDMQSVFGGEYPGAGAQLGQAMTFAWVAARHAASASSRARSTPAVRPAAAANSL